MLMHRKGRGSPGYIFSLPGEKEGGGGGDSDLQTGKNEKGSREIGLPPLIKLAFYNAVLSSPGCLTACKPYISRGIWDFWCFKKETWRNKRLLKFQKWNQQ